MIDKRIAIIGGGNLGRAIAEGILKSGRLAPENLTVTKRRVEMLADLQARGVHTTTDNAAAVRQADVVIVALKPYKVVEMMQEIASEVQPGKQLIISVATGVAIKTIQQPLPEGTSVMRAMPNTAIAVQESMTCLAHNGLLRADEKAFALDFFQEMGMAVYIPEEQMEAATVLAASGIAFALRYIRANMQGGIQIGFDSKLAADIATQTVKGAAQLLLKGGLHPEAEIDKVTTPMGITIAGLNEMEHQGFSSSMIRGIATSYAKIGK